MKNTAKKERKGKYLYRGYEIQCIGYYPPEKRIVWEANFKGEMDAAFHGFSLKEVKALIDNYEKKI